MYCNKCGNEINGSEKFCSKCGNMIENQQVMNNQSTIEVQQYNENSVNNSSSMSDKEAKKITNNMLSGYYLGMMILFDILGTFLISFIITTIGIELIDSGNKELLFGFGSSATVSLVVSIYLLFVPILVAVLVMPKRINKLKDKIPSDKRQCARKKIISILVIIGVIHFIFLMSNIIIAVASIVLYIVASMIVLKQFDK